MTRTAWLIADAISITICLLACSADRAAAEPADCPPPVVADASLADVAQEEPQLDAGQPAPDVAAPLPDAGVDAGRTCIPPGRIVTSGDSLTVGVYPQVPYPWYLAASVGRQVRIIGLGGSGVTPRADRQLLDVTDEPGIGDAGYYGVTVVLGVGTVDLVRGSTAEETAAGIAAYVQRHRARGYDVRVLQVPRMRTTLGDLDARRRALNATLRETYGAPELHAPYGDEADVKDLRWYTGDELHLTSAALELRAREALEALRRCP